MAPRIFKGSEDVQDESNVRPARQASNIQFSLVDATQDLFLFHSVAITASSGHNCGRVVITTNILIFHDEISF